MSVISNLPDTPNQNTSLSDYVIPSNLADVVTGWFNSKGFSVSASQLFANVLIVTVINNGGSQNDVLAALTPYQNLNPNTADLSKLAAYLLNSSRIPTSFLGNTIQPSPSRIYNRLVI